MRVPEPTALMEDPDQCETYNQITCTADTLKEYIELYDRLIGITTGTVVDLGSGSCNFVIALAEKHPNLKFICYEASDAMINIATRNINNRHLSKRIKIVKDRLENAQGVYDVVLANRVLHHVEDAKVFWKTVSRLSDAVLVVDIDRPPAYIIEQATDTDLLNSMKAAYTFSEVYDQVKGYKYTVAKDSKYRLVVYHTR